jgi:hypothetical protein
LKEKVQALIEGVSFSNIRPFLCFQTFQQTVAKASKKKRFSKVASSRCNHLGEFKTIIDRDVDFFPALSTESTAPEKVIPGFQQPSVTNLKETIVFKSAAFPYEHIGILGVHFDFQIHGEKIGA